MDGPRLVEGSEYDGPRLTSSMGGNSMFRFWQCIDSDASGNGGGRIYTPSTSYPYSIRGRNGFSGYGVQGSRDSVFYIHPVFEYCCAIPELTQLAMDQLNTALSLSMSMSGGTSCCDCYCDCIDDWNTVFPACIAMRTGGVIYSIPGKEFGCLERCVPF